MLRAFQHASERLRRDAHVVLRAVAADGHALAHAAPEMLDDTALLVTDDRLRALF